MKAWTRAALTVVGATALFVGGLTAPASADGGGSGAVTVLVQDRCDPVTFDLALSDPTACDPAHEGRVAFDKFFGSILADPMGVLQSREVRGWRFHSEDVTLRQGQDLVARSTGGEFHTFTQVAQFGGGCVPDLNAPFKLGFNAACQSNPSPFATSAVPPGSSLHVSGLAKGQYRFECMIHPWMRTDVTVR
jgi:hypothetical protein